MALVLICASSLLEAQPVFTNFTVELGPPTIVPNANPAVPTYPYAPDGHISYLPDNGMDKVCQMYWAGGNSYRSLGTDVSMQSLNPASPLIGPGASTNDYDNGGAWLMSVCRTGPNDLAGFYHAEDWNWPGYFNPAGNSNNIAWKSMAFCTSTNNGETWSKAGQFLTSSTHKPSVPTWGGTGDGCVVYDKANARWVCFYSGTWIIYAAISTNAIPLPGTWKKYHNGSFSTPGLGGQETPVPVLSLVPGANPSVHFNTCLQKWVMVWEASDGSGLYLSTSVNLLNWTTPKPLVTVTYPEQAWYATIIGSSDVEASSNAMLYYAYWPDVNTGPRQFVARTMQFVLTNSRPQTIIPMQTVPAWTALIQNTNVMDNGKTTTVPAQTRYTISAKTLLATIAQDEFREGNYGSNSFPSGSKLVLMTDPGSFAGSYYVVEDKTTNVLVNVSDLMTLQVSGNFTVYSYVVNDATGLGSPIINDYIATLNFDDTGAGGTMKFNLSRLVVATARDSALSNGTYTETVTTKAGVGNGTGNINGNNAVIYSAPETETGKGTFPLP
jgi:hypothetical protein